MAWKLLKGGFTAGTGNEDIDLQLASITNIELEHGSSATRHASGITIIGGNSYCYVDNTSDSVAKALEIKNTAGTIVFSATYVSNPSGTNHRFNKSTNTLGTVNVTFRVSDN